MNRHKIVARRPLLSAAAAVTIPLLVLFLPALHAQGADMEKRVAELKDSAAKNKQALAHYTWVEQLAIYLKGQERKSESFQVHMGPDGKPVKSPLDPMANAPSSPKGGRFRQRAVAKKKEEFEEYAERMKLLFERYVPPNKEDIQDAYSKGNVAITPSAGGSPDEIKFAIQNYVKAGDALTILFDKTKKQITSIHISTYLDSPTDKLDLTVTFSSLSDGTSHQSGSTLIAAAKQLRIVTENSGYRKL